VSSWHEPFAPPPPAPPLGANPRDDDGHRFDDSHGRFRTLYCATSADGALGECLADFVPSSDAIVRIESFLLSEPDSGPNESYGHVLDRHDIEGFEWQLAHAPARSEARLIDVDDWRTYLATSPHALGPLVRYGIRRLERSTLLDERRYVTRTLAGVWRNMATDSVSGRLNASGLRFTSRLPPAWECWALWEPLPIIASDVDSMPVTIDTVALRLAADKLGIALQA
jgi:hypothetical protein